MKSTQPQSNGSVRDALLRAVEVWKKAQVVHEWPSWEGRPEARAIAEQIALNHPECEQLLVNQLSAANQLVVAYALLTLELMNSPILRNLSPELLQRRSQITLVCGSFKNAMDLGGWHGRFRSERELRS